MMSFIFQFSAQLCQKKFENPLQNANEGSIALKAVFVLVDLD
jgi:hypothetical protein